MTVETIVSAGLIVFMLGAIALNEWILRRKVRDHVKRICKRDMEDTLRMLGLGKRKEDR